MGSRFFSYSFAISEHKQRKFCLQAGSISKVCWPTHLTSTVPEVLGVIVTRVHSHSVGVDPWQELLVVIHKLLWTTHGQLDSCGLAEWTHLKKFLYNQNIIHFSPLMFIAWNCCVGPGPRTIKLKWAQFWSQSQFSLCKSETEIKKELVCVLWSWGQALDQ